MLETLDYTIRIGSIPTFLYFDLYLYSAYAAHFVYFTKIYQLGLGFYNRKLKAQDKNADYIYHACFSACYLLWDSSYQ